MFKILKKIQFKSSDNKMKHLANTQIAIKYYKSKNKNLDFLLKKRFDWMNNFINENDLGIEVGSGVGFSKDYIKNKNFKISDISSEDHLDYKNIDAQSTGFADESFDFVIASNMVHHVPYPIKFFKEMYRILKKDGEVDLARNLSRLVSGLYEAQFDHWRGRVYGPSDKYDEIKSVSKQVLGL